MSNKSTVSLIQTELSSGRTQWEDPRSLATQTQWTGSQQQVTPSLTNSPQQGLKAQNSIRIEQAGVLKTDSVGSIFLW
jgi:hypothetical protein